jgi:hypothetical protein
MFVSKLPPSLIRCAGRRPASADRRTFDLALIGNLICSWSNNEPFHLCTDDSGTHRRTSAAVVFATLNDPRQARSDPAIGQDQGHRQGPR